MEYFRVLTDDEQFPDRWFLDEPITAEGAELDAREFTYGLHYAGPRAVRVPIQQAGSRVAFNLAAFDMPVVSDEIAQIMTEVSASELELFPVTVGSSISGYSIMNAISREACVDEERSKVTRWGPDDGRPDEIGRYRMVSKLAVDPSRTNNRHIFRITDFEVALIVSERIQQVLQAIPDLGVVFRPVC